MGNKLEVIRPDSDANKARLDALFEQRKLVTAQDYPEDNREGKEAEDEQQERDQD